MQIPDLRYSIDTFNVVPEVSSRLREVLEEKEYLSHSLDHLPFTAKSFNWPH